MILPILRLDITVFDMREEDTVLFGKCTSEFLASTSLLSYLKFRSPTSPAQALVFSHIHKQLSPQTSLSQADVGEQWHSVV
jgi:hypothetical protein